MTRVATSPSRRTTTLLFVVGGLLVAFGLAFFVSPLASSAPDGLERVSIDQRFDDTAQDHELADSTFADYGVEGVEDEGLATGIAGVVGVATTFGAAMILFASIRASRGRRTRSSAAEPEPAG